MKLISSLIASFLAFSYAQDNSTTGMPSTTEEMDMNMSSTMESSTTMYTTQEIVYETVPYDSADDPTDDLTNCVYSLEASFENLLDITISICGYTDEDDITYTDIKLNLPSDRWIIFGIKADGEVSNTDSFANYDGYNIEIPLDNAYGVDEAYYMADGEAIELPSSIEVFGDTISEGRRILRLLRLEQIVETAINDTELPANTTATEILDYYFDFGDLSTCNDAARISFTYGPNENARIGATKDKFISNTYGNRKAISVTYEEDCEVEIDDAPQRFINIFLSIFIGFIAMLI